MDYGIPLLLVSINIDSKTAKIGRARESKDEESSHQKKNQRGREEEKEDDRAQALCKSQ